MGLHLGPVELCLRFFFSRGSVRMLQQRLFVVVFGGWDASADGVHRARGSQVSRLLLVDTAVSDVFNPIFYGTR